MKSYGALTALALAAALAAAGAVTFGGQTGDKEAGRQSALGYYFMIAIRPANCTAPCAIHFLVETNDYSIVFFRWDINNDSVFDYPSPPGAWTTDTGYDKVFYEDHHGDACVEGWDGVRSPPPNYRACGEYSVNRPPPAVTISTTPYNATATLRIAGERWHNVSAYLVDGGSETLLATLMRVPGKPQEKSFPVTIDVAGNAYVKLVFAPEDKGTGATPAWLNFSAGSAEIASLHHTFKTSDNGTWVWKVDLNLIPAGGAVAFISTARLGGPGNVTFEWDFGDGSPVIVSGHFTRTTPFIIQDIQFHVYVDEGKYTLTVSATDDFGLKGSTSVEITITRTK